jgi:hypothetical protein
VISTILACTSARSAAAKRAGPRRHRAQRLRERFPQRSALYCSTADGFLGIDDVEIQNGIDLPGCCGSNCAKTDAYA